MCELFMNNKCLGCEGLQYDIDKLKLECETYKKEIQNEKMYRL